MIEARGEEGEGLDIRRWDALGVPDRDAVPRAAFKVTLGSLFRLVAALGGQVVLALVFGAGIETDAYLTAFAVPFFLQGVLLSGLPFTLLPAFVRLEAAGKEDDAWALVGTFVWLTGGLLILLAIAGSFFSSDVIRLSAPGLNPGKADQAARMLGLLIFSMPLVGLGNLTAAVENARDRFFWPALATGIGSVGNTVMVLMLYRPLGAQSMAWGYLVAAALQASVTVVPVLCHGWRRLMPLTSDRVGEIVRLMMPFMLFGTLIHSISLVERYYASSLPDGALSYLGYASKISGIVIAVLGTGIATAIFPAMTRAHVRAGESGLVERAEYGLRLTLAVALPSLAIVSAVAVPLVTVLFERGAFGHRATLNVGRILPLVMTSGVVFAMIGNLMSRVYYVMKDTTTASIVAALTSGLYILLAMVLVKGQGFVGLAWARLLSTGLSIALLSGLLIRRLSLQPSVLLKRALGYGSASLVAYLGARLALATLGPLPVALQLAAATLLAVSLYMTILLRLDPEVTGAILEMTGVRRALSQARAVLHL